MRLFLLVLLVPLVSVLGPEALAAQEAAAPGPWRSSPFPAELSEAMPLDAALELPSFRAQESGRPWWLWPAVGAIAGGVIGYYTLGPIDCGDASCRSRTRYVLLGAGAGAAAGGVLELGLRGFRR